MQRSKLIPIPESLCDVRDLNEVSIRKMKSSQPSPKLQDNTYCFKRPGFSGQPVRTYALCHSQEGSGLHHRIAGFVQSTFHLFLLSFCHIITRRLGRAGIITSISQMDRLRSKQVTSPRSQWYYGWNSTQSLAFLADPKKELNKKVRRREGRSL